MKNMNIADVRAIGTNNWNRIESPELNPRCTSIDVFFNKRVKMNNGGEILQKGTGTTSCPHAKE